jgi:hypothetical protein
MAKARYRIEQAEVVELSAGTRAVITDGIVYVHQGGTVSKLTVREAQILGAVVGIGDGIPTAVANAMRETKQVAESVELGQQDAA